MPSADSYSRMALSRAPLAQNTSLFRKTGGTSTITPSYPNRTASAGVTPVVNAPSGGGDGGGTGGSTGGYGIAAPAAAPARKSLAQVIDEDFALRQQYDENSRLEDEFETETGRLRGETERDQAVRREELQTDLADMSLDSSESLAARGLLNSGGLFVNQDKINAEGGRRESTIADMLTNLLTQRGQGLMQVQAQGRNAINDRISNITRDYGAGISGY